MGQLARCSQYQFSGEPTTSDEHPDIMLFLPPRLTLSHKVPHKHTLAWFILIFPPSGFTLRAEQCLLVPSWSPQQDRAISNRYCCTSEPGLFICTSPLFLTMILENKDILSLTEIHNISQLELFNQGQYSYQQIKQACKREQVWQGIGPKAMLGARGTPGKEDRERHYKRSTSNQGGEKQNQNAQQGRSRVMAGKKERWGSCVPEKRFSP